MIERIEEPMKKILIFKVEGTLHHEDYELVVIPEIEKTISQEKRINIMWEMNDFHGWDARAVWDDLRLGLKINKNVDKIAMLGDKKWEEWISKVLKHFAKGEIRYYKLDEEKNALAWLHAS